MYASGAKAILPAAPKALKTAVGTKLATEGFFASKLNINNATEMIAKIIEDTAVKSGKYIISTARIIGVAKSATTSRAIDNVYRLSTRTSRLPSK